MDYIYVRSKYEFVPDEVLDVVQLSLDFYYPLDIQAKTYGKRISWYIKNNKNLPEPVKVDGIPDKVAYILQLCLNPKDVKWWDKFDELCHHFIINNVGENLIFPTRDWEEMCDCFKIKSPVLSPRGKDTGRVFVWEDRGVAKYISAYKFFCDKVARCYGPGHYIIYHCIKGGKYERKNCVPTRQA